MKNGISANKWIEEQYNNEKIYEFEIDNLENYSLEQGKIFNELSNIYSNLKFTAFFKINNYILFLLGIIIILEK